MPIPLRGIVVVPDAGIAQDLIVVGEQVVFLGFSDLQIGTPAVKVTHAMALKTWLIKILDLICLASHLAS